MLYIITRNVAIDEEFACRFGGLAAGLSDTDFEEEVVELEKSNVLLLGPTGSGR